MFNRNKISPYHHPGPGILITVITDSKPMEMEEPLVLTTESLTTPNQNISGATQRTAKYGLFADTSRNNQMFLLHFTHFSSVVRSNECAFFGNTRINFFLLMSKYQTQLKQKIL